MLSWDLKICVRLALNYTERVLQDWNQIFFSIFPNKEMPLPSAQCCQQTDLLPLSIKLKHVVLHFPTHPTSSFCFLEQRKKTCKAGKFAFYLSLFILLSVSWTIKFFMDLVNHFSCTLHKRMSEWNGWKCLSWCKEKGVKISLDFLIFFFFFVEVQQKIAISLFPPAHSSVLNDQHLGAFIWETGWTWG